MQSMRWHWFWPGNRSSYEALQAQAKGMIFRAQTQQQQQTTIDEAAVAVNRQTTNEAMFILTLS